MPMDELGLWIGVTALRLEAELRAIGQEAGRLDCPLTILDGPPLHRYLHGDVPLRRDSLSILAPPQALEPIRVVARDRGWHERGRPEDGETDSGGASPSPPNPTETAVRLKMGRTRLEIATQVMLPALDRSGCKRLTDALNTTDIDAGEGLLLPPAEPLLVYLAARAASRGFALEDYSTDVRACALRVADWTLVDRIASDLGLPSEAFHGAKNGGTVNLDSLREALGTPSEGDARAPASVWFRGLTFMIQPGVFPPDAISERLLDVGLAAISDRSDPTVVDVGTGSGTVALALAAERPAADVWALDTSQEAISLCERNRDHLGLQNVRCRVGHLIEPLTRPLFGRVSAVLSNVPYVPPLLPGDERERYPAGTVIGPGQDGLGLLRELAEGARKVLEMDGTLVLQALDLQMERLSSQLSTLGYEVESPEDSLETKGSPIVLAAKWRGLS